MKWKVRWIMKWKMKLMYWILGDWYWFLGILEIWKNIEIEFKNVWFKYPSSTKYVLKNISFKISSGDILAIIGNNGAGKSTLMKLIFKIFEPSKGTILANGINIQNIKDIDYLKLFHILPQEFEIEDMLTIEELIYLGNSEKKMDVKKVIWAAKNSTAHTFVKDLKLGYKQKIFTNILYFFIENI